MSFVGTGTSAEGTARSKDWNGPERVGQVAGFYERVAEFGKLSRRTQGDQLIKGS